MGEKNEWYNVIEMLTQWLTTVKLWNTVNDTVTNSILNKLTLHMLHTAYNHNLTNLNWEENNYTRYNLGECKCGIVFQVRLNQYNSEC